MARLDGSFKGGAVTAKRSRESALKRYYENPNVCLFCGKLIEVPNDIAPSIIKLKKFCSRSCSANYNHKIKGHTLIKDKIEKERVLPIIDETMTIGSINGERASKYAVVRQKARAKMARSFLEKKCIICGYSVHVEVHHKKPCSEFSDDTLVSIVNDFSNLVYLCPNHHYEADKGLLKL